MTELLLAVLTSVALLLGSGFALVAALGIIRMPDVFLRMHAATKAGTLGASLILIAAALHASDAGVTARASATVLFLFLTAPVAGHVIGRAAYFRGARTWAGTRIDELSGHYDPDSHGLDAADAPRRGAAPPPPAALPAAVPPPPAR